jgi:hypothetical protein
MCEAQNSKELLIKQVTQIIFKLRSTTERLRKYTAQTTYELLKSNGTFENAYKANSV